MSHGSRLLMVAVVVLVLACGFTARVAWEFVAEPGEELTETQSVGSA